MSTISYVGNKFSRVSWRRSKGTVVDDPSPIIIFNNYASLLTAVGLTERKFFDYLDAEVEEAEQFYQERFQEAVFRLAALKEQLKELGEHRNLYHASLKTSGWQWKGIYYVPKVPGQVRGDTVSSFTRRGEAATEDAVTETSGTIRPLPFSRDPDTYHSSRKNLKHAVLEHYHFLELLKNYQTLNVTAIHKSIKKFENATAVSVHMVYNRDRTGCIFSGENDIKKMIESMEELYASRFEGGDKKKARDRLRMLGRTKTHHFSTFRTGIYLGLTIPALVVGVYNVCQSERRNRILLWQTLLEAYATLAMPTILSLLIGLNVLVWSRKRINYVFIFELDLRSVMDPRMYFEIPSFLCMALAYAFMLSFSGVIDQHVDPTLWPAIWMAALLLVLFNPLPVFHHKAQFWLIRNWFKLLLPGFTTVEFADFWMGDQLCSMAFSLGHLYFLACPHATNWDSPMARCNLAKNWIAGILLTLLPSFIRLIQCIKRYVDSKNYLHLVNCGKYTSSCTKQLAYGDLDLGSKWPLLRQELVCGDHVYVYYIAMVTNVLIRFSWIMHLPIGPAFDPRARSIVAGILEMLRRVQWNFFRVGNEHLGNADQYRVTREVPLLYSFDQTPQDDSDDDENDKEVLDVTPAQSSCEPFVELSDGDRPQSVRIESLPGEAEDV
ncbi:hypothetical protein FRB94_012433 [Tulasnella sp. JGI-2019a]|nr:hypothetical protein FRB94_012433 [Tulasnella sp. JGI-2019a]